MIRESSHEPSWGCSAYGGGGEKWTRSRRRAVVRRGASGIVASTGANDPIAPVGTRAAVFLSAMSNLAVRQEGQKHLARPNATYGAA